MYLEQVPETYCVQLPHLDLKIPKWHQSKVVVTRISYIYKHVFCKLYLKGGYGAGKIAQ